MYNNRMLKDKANGDAREEVLILRNIPSSPLMCERRFRLEYAILSMPGCL
jgi:hypothetical protein